MVRRVVWVEWPRDEPVKGVLGVSPRRAECHGQAVATRDPSCRCADRHGPTVEIRVDQTSTVLLPAPLMSTIGEMGTFPEP